MSTQEMFAYSEERRKEEEHATRPILVRVERTGYAIRHAESGYWLGNNNHWVVREYARQFEFMTSAMAYVVSMGYDPETVTVELV